MHLQTHPLRIYVLICVGLAVDYAAHIAHMFKDLTGFGRKGKGRGVKGAEGNRVWP